MKNKAMEAENSVPDETANEGSDPEISSEDAKIRDAYNTGLATPYCSVTPIFHAAGKSVPAAFGNNCIGQAEIVVQELRSIPNAEPKYVRDGRHQAVVLEHGNKTLFFDPYLLHADPIDLESVRSSANGRQRFPAYPIVTDHRNKVHKGSLDVLFKEDKRAFSIRKAKFDAVLDQHVISEFSLNLDNTSPNRTDRSDPQIAFAQEQTTLSIRVLLQENKSTVYIIYPIAETHPHGIIDVNRLHVKNNSGEAFARGSDEYASILRDIAERLGHSKEAVESFMMDGVTLYEQNAPKDITYFSINPTNK